MVSLPDITTTSAAIATTLLLLLLTTGSLAQSTPSVCDGKIGEAKWTCDPLTPIPPDTFDTDFLPLPGSPDPTNPTRYKQIAGSPAFDEETGERNSDAAVFVLTEGFYMCMLAESDGAAALFDAPEDVDLFLTNKAVTSLLN